MQRPLVKMGKLRFNRVCCRGYESQTITGCGYVKLVDGYVHLRERLEVRESEEEMWISRKEEQRWTLEQHRY